MLTLWKLLSLFLRIISWFFCFWKPYCDFHNANMHTCSKYMITDPRWFSVITKKRFSGVGNIFRITLDLLEHIKNIFRENIFLTIFWIFWIFSTFSKAILEDFHIKISRTFVKNVSKFRVWKIRWSNEKNGRLVTCRLVPISNGLRFGHELIAVEVEKCPTPP